MRPINKGNCPKDNQGKNIIFTQYQNARKELIHRIGQFCSYCNMRLETSLAVEHIHPKDLNPNLALTWDNFLLACTNCNSTKGAKSIILKDYFWSDIHNTHIPFLYFDDGRIEINKSKLSDEEQEIAQNTMDLVGLQKYPDLNNASDRRWINRKTTFDMAIECKKELDAISKYGQEARTTAISLVTKIAHAKGYWSIWFHVFEQDNDVKQTLIEKFEGTDILSFDKNNNYTPLKRKTII